MSRATVRTEVSEQAGAGPRVGHRAWLPVALTMFAVAWGGNEFTPLLVMYREVGHFSAVTVDALLAAYVLGIVPALLLGGPLSDRYGRRPLLLPAAPVGLVGSLVLAVGAQSAALLAVGRVLCGVALGLVMAVGTTWVCAALRCGLGRCLARSWGCAALWCGRLHNAARVGYLR